MKRILMVLAFLAFASQALALGIQINWDANTEEDLAGYKVYYGTIAGGPYNNPIIVPVMDNPEVGIGSGLILGQTYFVKVTAFDESGNESQPSDEASILFVEPGPPPDTTPPGKPQNLRLFINVFFSNTWDWFGFKVGRISLSLKYSKHKG